MLACERETIKMMRAGRRHRPAIASLSSRQEIEREHANLSQSQRQAVEQILARRDKVTALEGIAGAGKTTSLVAIREAAEREGYGVEGFAPTSRAAQKLREAGIESSTLQRHLAHSEERQNGNKRLYVLDESSLASTKQSQLISCETYRSIPIKSPLNATGSLTLLLRSTDVRSVRPLRHLA